MYSDFIAEHPFIFALQSNSTGLIYFAGRVLTLEDSTSHDEL